MANPHKKIPIVIHEKYVPFPQFLGDLWDSLPQTQGLISPLMMPSPSVTTNTLPLEVIIQVRSFNKHIIGFAEILLRRVGFAETYFWFDWSPTNCSTSSFYAKPNKKSIWVLFLVTQGTNASQITNPNKKSKWVFAWLWIQYFFPFFPDGMFLKSVFLQRKGKKKDLQKFMSPLCLCLEYLAELITIDYDRKLTWPMNELMMDIHCLNSNASFQIEVIRIYLRQRLVC